VTLPTAASIARALTALVLGAAVAASGFPPLANAPDVLEIGLTPWRVALTPAVLLAAAAVGVAVVIPQRMRVDRAARLLIVAAALLLAGAALSLIRSDDLWYSILVGIVAIAAPIAFAAGIARSGLPRAVLAGAFLAVVAVFLLRADLQFFRLNGFPSPSTLLAAKFRDQPYDFHYFTLGNPDGTAAFLLMPFALAVIWLASPNVRRRTRLLLAGSAMISGATLVLAYSRSALGWAVVISAVAILQAPLRRRLRTGLLAVLVLLSLCAVVVLNRTYLLGIFSGNSASVRTGSITDAAGTFWSNPLTGFGLGMFNTVDGFVPAHSAIVQSAVELGLAGLIGAIALVWGATWTAWRRLRESPGGLARAAAIAAAGYVIYCAFAGGASEALYSGFSSLWGFSLALMLAIAVTPAGSGSVQSLPIQAADGP
jgi:O-antigen ligase